MSICFFLYSYSSDQHTRHYFSQDDLSELQKAEYHKKRLGMPTPASFGQLQVETPFQMRTPLQNTKLMYLEEWLNNSFRIENQLARLSEHREWIENLENEAWENLLNQEEFERLNLVRRQAMGNRGRAEQPFNATNKQVIGSSSL